jgi:hypothetical protein
MFDVRLAHPLDAVRLDEFTDTSQLRQHIVRQGIQLRRYNRIQGLYRPYGDDIA